ncbi:WD40-repeat-containing domain protein [Mycena olivaceomarginata]|nr:WD40-repeat-containing domain protein [Mycena olivaceomarginata]
MYPHPKLLKVSTPAVVKKVSGPEQVSAPEPKISTLTVAAVRTLKPLHRPAHGVGTQRPTPPLIAVAVQHPSFRSTPATAKQYITPPNAAAQHSAPRPSLRPACLPSPERYPQATARTHPHGRHPTLPLIEPAARHCPASLVPPGTRDGEATHTTSAPEPIDSRFLVSGAADNTLRLWNVATGQCLYTWEFSNSVKRVAFNEDGTQVVCVIEQRMGYPSNIRVFDINRDGDGTNQAEQPLHLFNPVGSKATMCAFTLTPDIIITGHTSGKVALYSVQTGEEIECNEDRVARIHDTKTLEIIKTYTTETPLNSATRPYVLLGSGLEPMSLTVTHLRQGKFETRIWHKVYEEEVGRVEGHFGPINTIATLSAEGSGSASISEEERVEDAYSMVDETYTEEDGASVEPAVERTEAEATPAPTEVPGYYLPEHGILNSAGGAESLEALLDLLELLGYARPLTASKADIAREGLTVLRPAES